jgi:D-glycero-alpha-D-manno-heptose 1-phosphate guanylyltransferase
MEVIILAGGFGTRLQSMVKDVPKPMADINGKPFLIYILEYLLKNGIRTVILSIGYKKEIIENYFGNSYKTIKILYSKEDEVLGTGGAIKKALSLCKEKNILVLNGDTFFELNLQALIEYHQKREADVTLSLKKMYDFDRYGKVIIDKNRVLSFKEKGFFSSGFINGGVYIIKRDIFVNYGKKFSFEEFLEKNLSILNICAYIDKGYFIDIGIPQDYQKAIYDFGSKKALFLDRDGIINIDYGHVYKKEEFVWVSGIFELCKYFQNNNYLIFIVTNQSGIAKEYYSEKEFKSLTNWMLNEFHKKDIIIEDVFYCPHYLNDKCKCRKPSPKMLFDIQNKYQISLKKSILIGDKYSDIELGERAGICELVLIKSKYQEEYDFLNLSDYINYLIKKESN